MPTPELSTAEGTFHQQPWCHEIQKQNLKILQENNIQPKHEFVKEEKPTKSCQLKPLLTITTGSRWLFFWRADSLKNSHIRLMKVSQSSTICRAIVRTILRIVQGSDSQKVWGTQAAALVMGQDSETAFNKTYLTLKTSPKKPVRTNKQIQ